MSEVEDRRRERQRRYATRQEAMAYAKIGSTAMNELLHSNKIYAKKQGPKVIVDLNSIDDYYDGLPDVAAANAKQQTETA